MGKTTEYGNVVQQIPIPENKLLQVVRTLTALYLMEKMTKDIESGELLSFLKQEGVEWNDQTKPIVQDGLKEILQQLSLNKVS